MSLSFLGEIATIQFLYHIILVTELYCSCWWGMSPGVEESEHLTCDLQIPLEETQNLYSIVFGLSIVMKADTDKGFIGLEHFLISNMLLQYQH